MALMRKAVGSGLPAHEVASRRSPAWALFSGWNCTAKMLSRATAQVKGCRSGSSRRSRRDRPARRSSCARNRSARRRRCHPTAGALGLLHLVPAHVRHLERCRRAPPWSAENAAPAPGHQAQAGDIALLAVVRTASAGRRRCRERAFRRRPRAPRRAGRARQFAHAVRHRALAGHTTRRPRRSRPDRDGDTTSCPGATCSIALRHRAQVAHAVVDTATVHVLAAPGTGHSERALGGRHGAGRARDRLHRHAQRAGEGLEHRLAWWCALSPRRLSMCSVTRRD
jgi:hypothetical protein